MQTYTLNLLIKLFVFQCNNFDFRDVTKLDNKKLLPGLKINSNPNMRDISVGM